jgi:hypothetical protein
MNVNGRFDDAMIAYKNSDRKGKSLGTVKKHTAYAFIFKAKRKDHDDVANLQLPESRFYYYLI